jgi:hypothetical protein
MDKMGSEKISSTPETDYLAEKLHGLKEAVLEMEKALKSDDARKFVDNFGQLQYKEKSLIVAVKRVMRICKFSEQDLMMQPIVEYQKV